MNENSIPPGGHCKECTYIRYRKVSMVAISKDAGPFCSKADKKIEDVTQCPLDDKQCKFTVIYMEIDTNDGRKKPHIKNVFTDDLKVIMENIDDIFAIQEGWPTVRYTKR